MCEMSDGWLAKCFIELQIELQARVLPPCDPTTCRRSCTWPRMLCGLLRSPLSWMAPSLPPAVCSAPLTSHPSSNSSALVPAAVLCCSLCRHAMPLLRSCRVGMQSCVHML